MISQAKVTAAPTYTRFYNNGLRPHYSEAIMVQFMQSRAIGVLFAALSTLAAGPDVLANEPKGQFFGARQTEYPDWFKSSFFNLPDDVAEAAKTGKRVMLLFSQSGCPYCNALVERNLSQKDIQETIRRHLDVVHLNLWGDSEVTGMDGKRYSEKTFAAAMRVQFTPTILFLDEQGNTILRLNGYLPPNRFKVALDFVTQKKEKASTFREYQAAHRPAQMAGALNAEPFFGPAPYDLRPSAIPGGKPVAVFFEQKDCPDCDTLHKKVLVDKNIRQSLAPFHVIQLDMWANTAVITPEGKKSTARDWAKTLGVNYAPTIVVLNAEGREVIRSEAMFKVFHTRGILDYVSSGGYREQPSFQRWLSARADHLREQGQDVDIWSYTDEKPVR